MKLNKLIVLIIISSFLFFQPIAFAKTIAPVPVKKSITGICHKLGSTYYNRTKIFKAYKTMADCLKSGGRLPK